MPHGICLTRKLHSTAMGGRRPRLKNIQHEKEMRRRKRSREGWNLEMGRKGRKGNEEGILIHESVSAVSTTATATAEAAATAKAASGSQQVICPCDAQIELSVIWIISAWNKDSQRRSLAYGNRIIWQTYKATPKLIRDYCVIKFSWGVPTTDSLIVFHGPHWPRQLNHIPTTAC